MSSEYYEPREFNHSRVEFPPDIKLMPGDEWYLQFTRWGNSEDSCRPEHSLEAVFGNFSVHNGEKIFRLAEPKNAEHIFFQDSGDKRYRILPIDVVLYVLDEPSIGSVQRSFERGIEQYVDRLHEIAHEINKESHRLT